jgi:glutathione S-transferase
LLAGKIAAGERALGVMEGHLKSHRWFAGDAYSIADIALYAYTHVADEGGAFDLRRTPAIQDWLKRVAAEQRHVAITA